MSTPAASPTEKEPWPRLGVRSSICCCAWRPVRRPAPSGWGTKNSCRGGLALFFSAANRAATGREPYHAATSFVAWTIVVALAAGRGSVCGGAALGQGLARKAQAGDQLLAAEVLESIESFIHLIPAPLRVPLDVFVQGKRESGERLVISRRAAARG